MVLRLNQSPMIEDVRKHPAELVENLRALLASGASAKPDPHRENFFEVENCQRVFYIHIAPATGKVYLLGTWLKDETPADCGKFVA